MSQNKAFIVKRHLINISIKGQYISQRPKCKTQHKMWYTTQLHWMYTSTFLQNLMDRPNSTDFHDENQNTGGSDLFWMRETPKSINVPIHRISYTLAIFIQCKGFALGKTKIYAMHKTWRTDCKLIQSFAQYVTTISIPHPHRKKSFITKQHWK